MFTLYMTVHDGTLQYKAKSITVYGSTWQHIAVLSCWICIGDFGAQHARLKALHWGTVHKCMRTQVYSASGTPGARASLETLALPVWLR